MAPSAGDPLGPSEIVGQPLSPGRRRLTALLAGFGVASTGLADPLWALVEAPASLTTEDLVDAEKLAGVEFSEDERQLMLEGLQDLQADYARLRELELDNSVAPALQFRPIVPPPPVPAGPRPALRPSRVAPPARPSTPEQIAFLPITQLSQLIRARQISSLELTQLSLERLKRHDAVLHCVITLTEELALEQARRADRELAAGHYRGPLHGIPWGAKDLLTKRGYPTTWGAAPFRDQVLDDDATVVTRLEEAGAVLVAKLTLGALAWGDVWFGEKTRNPWNPEHGSSGSSAGSASATAAGLVAFAIGTETLGSIVSPATRCGVSGLRPTFGRVSRHGAMALSWSMDKIGPICRTVEDCALVFDAIRGSDPRDDSAVDAPFDWDPDLDVRRLRVGYLRGPFETEEEAEEDDEDGTRLEAAREWRRIDLAALDALRGLGVEPIPIDLPELPVSALSFILDAEAAAAFDQLTRSERDDLMVRQIERAWPNAFRRSRLIPAVEYIQANRVRTLVMREMERLLTGIDVYVARSFGGGNLLTTNLTGHPAVVVPDGFRSDGTPTSLTFTGRLWGEADMLSLAQAYQDATPWHRRHPEPFASG